jgi:hypothetical protein
MSDVQPAEPDKAASTTEASNPPRGAAKLYLYKLLEDIATMLDYVAENGIPLSESLRKKIDALMSDPEVQASDMFSTDPKDS